MSMGTLMVIESAEARRRRDERGRYMEVGEEEMRMRGERGVDQSTQGRRNEMTTGRSAMEGDMRRSEVYNRGDTEMRRRNEYSAESRRGERRNASYDRPEMGGEGYVVWDSMDPRHPPRESNDRDYWRRGDEEGGNITDMREYGRRYSAESHLDPNQKNHRQMTQQRHIGFQRHQAKEGRLDRETAEEWVEGMKSPKWPNMADVKMLAQKCGITGEEEMAEFWAVLNATYSDVSKVAKKYNVDRTDFYADLAKALFLEDEDAMPGKAALYYEYLVKKEDD